MQLRSVCLSHNCNGKVVEKLRGHRTLRLTEEVGDQLGGVVPAGVFEVDELEPAVVHSQGVVEPKVRRRQALVRRRYRVIQFQAEVGGLVLRALKYKVAQLRHSAAGQAT